MLHEFLEKLSHLKVERSTSNKLDIVQKQRNAIGNQFKQALFEMLQDLSNNENADIFVEETADGIAVAVGNESLKGGNITFTIKATVKKLDYDIAAEADAYRDELEMKAQEKEQKEKAKQAKIKADALKREQKKLEKAVRQKVVKGEMTMKEVKALVEDQRPDASEGEKNMRLPELNRFVKKLEKTATKLLEKEKESEIAIETIAFNYWDPKEADATLVVTYTNVMAMEDEKYHTATIKISDRANLTGSYIAGYIAALLDRN